MILLLFPVIIFVDGCNLLSDVNKIWLDMLVVFWQKPYIKPYIKYLYFGSLMLLDFLLAGTLGLGCWVFKGFQDFCDLINNVNDTR